jgi:isopenicillin-N epimerase
MSGDTKLKELFLLQPGITFLNHGSYGACPKPVFEVYQEWQRELEAQPVEFLSRKAPELLRAARSKLADYLHTETDNLVFVTNATTGINIVARSLKLGAGDEILGTDQEYGAIDRTWRFLCNKSGARYVNLPIPLPIESQEAFIERFWAGVTPRTRVISLSHITSATALIFPIKEICRRAREAGILTVIDGAHAPGQIELDLEDLGADFYAGNCHKWLCAPKGAAFLYARPEAQQLVEPFVVSWGWESEMPGPSPFVDWLEWQGTRDVAPWLAVPAAIEFQKQHNWEEVRKNCHQLLIAAGQEIGALTGLPSIYASDEWFAQMATIPWLNCDSVLLKQQLWEDYKIELPVINWHNQLFLRVSFQGYNTRQDLDYLLAALKQLLPA